MATYFGLAVFVGNGSYTSTSSITNWSTIRPTYFSYNYNGTKTYYALSSSNWSTSIYTNYDGRQYAIYVMDYSDTNTQGILTRVGANCWLHNDSVTTPDSYSINVNNKKHVYLYEADTPFQNLTIEYKGNTSTTVTNVFHFDAYWNFWKAPEYGTPYYGLYKGVIDILTNPTMNEIDSHRDNGYLNGPGNNGLTFVELKYTQDDLPYHGFHVGILPPNHTLQSNYAGLSSSNTTYGSKNIYCFNIKSKLTTDNPAMTVSTNNTKTHLLYAIYNGGKNNYNYNVGFWGTTSGSTVTNPAHGLYNYSNIAFDTWGKYVLTGDTIGECYAINVDGTSKFILQEIPIKLGKKYTFTIWGDGRKNYDGVVLGKTELSAGSYASTLASVFGSNTNVLGYGSFKTGGNQITVTYTPDADRTIYMYVKKSSTASTSYQSYNGTTFGSVCVNTEDLPAYTVTLNKNGGTGGTDSVSIVPGTAAADYPAITLPTRSGYIFQGYYDAQTGGTAYYNAAGQGIRVFDKLNAVTIFYAHWQQESLPTITVTLNKNGGSGGQDTVSVVSGQMVGTVTVPSRTGFTFLGYYSSVSSNASGNKYIDNSGTGCKAISSAMTLYALWQNDVVYNPYDTVGIDPEIIYSTSSQSVTIANSAGSCGGGTLTYTDEAEDITISNGGKTATIPGGWNVGTYVLSLDVASPTSATTNGYFGVTRSFDILIIINQATPTFELQGASVASGSTAQAKVRTSVPGTVYWGTSSSSMTNTMSISASQVTTLVNLTNATNSTAGTTVTIYARFVPTDTTNYDSVSTKTATLTVAPPTTTTIVITLNDNGGSGGSGSIVVEKDSHISTWPNVNVPTRAGFTFMGYYTVSAATGGTQVYTSNGGYYYSSYSTSSDVTIYARWKVIIYYDHNHKTSETAMVGFVSNQPGEATSTSSAVTMQIDGVLTCVVSSRTFSVTSSGKTNWTINTTGTQLTIPSGVSYSSTFLTWTITVADGTYGGYPYVGNSYNGDSNSGSRYLYYNLKKVEYEKETSYPYNAIKYKDMNGTLGYNVTSSGTPVLSFYSYALTASGGQLTKKYDSVVKNNISWYQKYTNGTWDTTPKSQTDVSSEVKWRIYSETKAGATTGFYPEDEGSQLLVNGQYITVYSGNCLHNNMTDNVGTDSITFIGYNADDPSKTVIDGPYEKSNTLLSTHYSDTNGTEGNKTINYGVPYISLVPDTTSRVEAFAPGSTTYASVYTSSVNSGTWYQKYSSGTYSLFSGTIYTSAKWRIASQSCAGGTNRFDNYSGTSSSITVGGSSYVVYLSGEVKHSTMGTNAGDDTVAIMAYNVDDLSKTATSSVTVTNGYTDTYKGITSYGTPVVTIGSGFTASNGSAIVTCTVTNSVSISRKYDSGSTSNYTSASPGVAKWKIDTNGSNRFTASGTSSTFSGLTVYNDGDSIAHSTMGTWEGTDTVVVRAYNASSTKTTPSASASASVTNSIVSTGNPTIVSYGTPTVTIGTGITAAGGSATVTCAVSNTQRVVRTYTTGATSNEDTSVSGTAKWRVTVNGSSRFTASGTSSALGSVTVYNTGGKVNHTTMASYVGTDSVTVTAYNVNSSSKTKTATVSVSNAYESLKISGAANSISFGATTSGSVYASYTSGLEVDVTDSIAVNATSGNRITSSNTNIITIS